MAVQVLVDADNVSRARLQPVLDLLATREPAPAITASGRPAALARLRWPARTVLLPHEGWQRADLALAAAYCADSRPLILITGDGDFGLLAARHPGPVLIVSGSPSGRLRDAGTVVDPALEGTEPIRGWLEAHREGAGG